MQTRTRKTSEFHFSRKAGHSVAPCLVLRPHPVTISNRDLPPSLLRSIVKPVSPVELSVHVRSTCVSEKAVATRLLGAAGMVVTGAEALVLADFRDNAM